MNSVIRLAMMGVGSCSSLKISAKMRHSELTKIGDTSGRDLSLSNELFEKNVTSLMSSRPKSAEILKSFVSGSSRYVPAAFSA